ncbi:MAG: polysaccharide biosynthesis/export family protein [Planctomycetales bacterium]|nr:polysaccharide biosynthesis/export family protein [Planctomycetales bacterium]MCA9166384.1 polysaccharide biosynthesis/export family protein [Planctomycetales bacterium]
MNCHFGKRANLAAIIALGICLSMVASLGCSTASSLGLPVASGPYKLLAAAGKIRNTTGHADDVPNETSKSVQVAHRVEPGDVLIVEPSDFDSPIRFPSDQTVQADGTIDLGHYGRVQVAGLTLDEIKQRAEVRVAANFDVHERDVTQASYNGRDSNSAPVDTSLSVRLVSDESSLVYVLGEVNAPGSYPIVGRETVLDELIAAGGLTERANEHKIILTRPASPDMPRQIYPICYQQIVQLGDTSTNYQVKPGDRIYIPSMTMLEDIRQSVQFKERSCPHCRDFSP